MNVHKGNSLEQGWPNHCQGAKIALQDIFKCPLNFFEKLHLLKSFKKSAILDRKVHN